MIVRQLIDRETYTYTYLVVDAATKDAVIIDPVDTQIERDMRIVEELELNLRYTMETHVHADHITASGAIRERTGAQSVVSSRAGIGCADIMVSDGDELRVGNIRITTLSTPGHTDGCSTYVARYDNDSVAFTGDALLIRGCGRTDFQNGDASELYRSVRDKIFQLSNDTIVYPAHDYRGETVSSIAEEKAFNPRLGDGISLEAFCDIMATLDLDHPSQMDTALPANLACGKRTIRELGPDEDFTHFRIVDVRQHEEFVGELGHLDRAELVPLLSLESATKDWDRNAPLLLVCRSGARSMRGCLLLQRLGFHEVSNLRGGMLAQKARQGSCG